MMVGMGPAETLEQSRKFLMTLPEVSERLSHGAPAFFAAKKCFVMYMNNHHDVGWCAFWCAANHEFQVAMVAQDAGVYFVPPYVGHRGWLGIRLDAGVSWDQIQNHLLEAYCLVATVKLLAKLESAGES